MKVIPKIYKRTNRYCAVLTFHVHAHVATASGTAAGELNTSDRVALGVGLGIGIPTLLLTCISIIAGANWCCGKRNKEGK